MRSTDRSLFRAFLATSAFLAGLVLSSALIEGCGRAATASALEASDGPSAQPPVARIDGPDA